LRITQSLLDLFFEEPLSKEIIAKTLTDIGVEVDSVLEEKLAFSPVICGQITDINPHPNADKLRLLTVDTGKNSLTVVCGDGTLQKNDRVPLVQEGAYYLDPTGKKTPFKPRKIREVLSPGMLLSSQELGLKDEVTEGVLRLDEHIALGENLNTLLEDRVYECSLTPNLGYCMSAFGLARQLSAILQIPYKLPSFSLKTGQDTTDFSVKSSDHCPLYALQKMNGVSVKPSSLTIQRTLALCGLRPISNVVDITNLMMLIYGQPMHAFDLDRLEGKKITIGKTDLSHFETLDHNKHQAKDILAIQDAKGAVAIAGVIGGQESSVTEKTTNILFEAAYFDPMEIRKSIKKIQTKTESAQRFEKGIDPLMTKHALSHACHLLHTLTHATVSKPTIYENLPEERVIAFDPEKAVRFLGISLTLSELEVLLGRLDLTVIKKQQNKWHLRLPHYRFDLTEAVDLTEEIAKVYGYNHIPRDNPLIRIPNAYNSPLHRAHQKIKEQLTRLGLFEIITCNLISEKQAKQFQDPYTKDLVKTVYSKSEQHRVLRSSLLPSHLETIRFNQARSNYDLAFFEMSSVHFKKEEKVFEESVVAITVTGKKTPEHFSEKSSIWDFLSFKGLLEQFFDSFDMPVSFLTSSHPFFHPFNQSLMSLQGKTIGLFGQVHPSHLDDVKTDLFFCQIDIESLIPHTEKSKVMRDIPQFPSSQRDWTLTVDGSFVFQNLKDQINSIKSPILEDVKIIDRYVDSSLGKEKANLTLRFSYRDAYKTLSYDEVEHEHNRILSLIS
jgi:phenylalanyl-tRNA synthetase beta chain